MVMLYVPFRNKIIGVIDHNKFIQIYDKKKKEIPERNNEYESGIDQIVMSCA